MWWICIEFNARFTSNRLILAQKSLLSLVFGYKQTRWSVLLGRQTQTGHWTKLVSARANWTQLNWVYQLNWFELEPKTRTKRISCSKTGPSTSVWIANPFITQTLAFNLHYATTTTTSHKKHMQKQKFQSLARCSSVFVCTFAFAFASILFEPSPLKKTERVAWFELMREPCFGGTRYVCIEIASKLNKWNEPFTYLKL